MSQIRIDSAEALSAEREAMLRRREQIGGDGLRLSLARGTIVNTLYLIGLGALSIVQGVLVAALLGAPEYGLWGLLVITFGTLFALAAVGIDDKYINQDHPDQRAAFEIAFTLQSMLCGLFTVIALVAIPVFSIVYDEPRILLPGLLLAVALPLLALQAPIWVFYRRMDFVKQRVLESCNPVVAFVVTVPLALAGVGFWSLVIGSLAGALAAAAVTVRCTPYPLRFRYERGALREYATFSWPLFVSSSSAVLMWQVPLTIAARSLGAASIGAMTLASQMTHYTKQVDEIVTHALYPAICAAKDRGEVLFESFSKSNRLALLWGFPVGIGAVLFAEPAVHFVLGSDWSLAVPLIQVLGVSAALDQIGFNWTAFARARGETRVLAVASIAQLVAVLGVGVPLLLEEGLSGLAIGIGAGTVASLVIRIGYLVKLFPALDMVGHVARAVAPTAAAAALILLERVVIGYADPHSPARALGELAAYAVVIAAVTWSAEGALLREAVGYLRRAGRRTASGVPENLPSGQSGV
jgi:O-antigen/teichoic acid export membrane protein